MRIDENALRAECLTIYDHILRLHLIVGETLLFGKFAPLADKELALSMAVDGRNGVDVNLALFETLGRMAICWHCAAMIAE